MSETKCCGNCARFFNEDAKGNGFCSISPNRQVVTCRHNTCIAHEWKLPKWTEITPDHVEDLFPVIDRVMVAYKLGEGLAGYSSLTELYKPLKDLALTGGYYYIVLPELKIE